MTQTGDKDPAAPADGAKCQSARELLDQIKTDISTYQAKKLDELKTQLEGFVAKLDALIPDYAKQYPALRDRWCTQHQAALSIYSSLKCAFPGQDWKAIVTKCICAKKQDVRCQQERLDKRKRCCKGQRERARDDAQAVQDAAKANLDALSNNAQGVGSVLTDIDKWLKEIPTLLGPDQAVALYVAFFKLFPAINAVMPADTDCKPIALDETPDKLCPPGKCDPEPGGCTPAAEGAALAQPPQRRRAPWLVPPDRYEAELNCAWLDYRAAKDAWGKADQAFKADPDDVASLEKKLGDAQKALEDDIKKCLKDSKSNDCCTKTGDANKPADATKPASTTQTAG